MARQIHDRDIAPTLRAAATWIDRCLIADGSIFSSAELWTQENVAELVQKFSKRPDFSSDDFLTKLRRQMDDVSSPAKRLMAEMLWALLLFPSNMKSTTKRQQIISIWSLSDIPMMKGDDYLRDEVLFGIGSGGPGFNNYRADELAFFISLVGDLKERAPAERKLLKSYDAFMKWIEFVPQKGRRQYRHMLRYFAFPDRVERISSNNDRCRILEAFGVASIKSTKNWPDDALDEALLQLRHTITKQHPNEIVDFYSSDLKPRWAKDQKVKTVDGEVTVVVPIDEDDEDEVSIATIIEQVPSEQRPSFQIQAKLAEIGARMGFKVWLPRTDRGRVGALMANADQIALLEELPLNYEKATLDTIEQIDVIWLRGRSIVRAFEVEHTTAVYSGLLRMADLLALQPNMDIRLHIVAPDERRDKVFREMLRPVFSLLDRKPLAKSCSFISYESVIAIRSIDHLAHINDTVISEFEEQAES